MENIIVEGSDGCCKCACFEAIFYIARFVKKLERPEILGTGAGLEFNLREGPAVNGAEPAQY